MHSMVRGDSFGAWATVARGTGNLANAFLLQLRDGRVVAAYRNHELGADGKATRYRLTVLSEIAERAATAKANGLWARVEPRGLRVSDPLSGSARTSEPPVLHSAYLYTGCKSGYFAQTTVEITVK
ncbi:hypothetical protein LXA43DRAFT_1114070 [Ganoderma leucocontextum]|nr:hypothetical protein LXA43DRAFT_1114070 [Ganoderma leucocontextum]